MGINASRPLRTITQTLIIVLPCASVATIAAHIYAVNTRRKLAGEDIPPLHQICQLIGTLAGVYTTALIIAQLNAVLPPLIVRGITTAAVMSAAASQTHEQLVNGYDLRQYTADDILAIDKVPPTEVAVLTTSLSSAAWLSMTNAILCTTLYMGVNWGVTGTVNGPFAHR